MACILAALKSLKHASHSKAFKQDIHKHWSVGPSWHNHHHRCLPAGCGLEHLMTDFTSSLSLRNWKRGCQESTNWKQVTIALKLLGSKIKGLKFIINCDNQTTVSVINSGRAQDSFLQACAREVVILACKYQVEIWARHIPSVDNRLPDLLCQASIKKYFTQFQCETGKWFQEIVPENYCKFSNKW